MRYKKNKYSETRNDHVKVTCGYRYTLRYNWGIKFTQLVYFVQLYISLFEKHSIQ